MNENKKNRFFSEDNNQFVFSNQSQKIKTQEDESVRSRDNSGSFFKFGFLKQRNTVSKLKKGQESEASPRLERKDTDNFIDLSNFKYEDSSQQANLKNSFNLGVARKSKARRKSFEAITQNEFKKLKKESKPMDLKFG